VTSLVELSYKWYALMSQFTAQIGEPVQTLFYETNISGLSALLLGLLGALAPCQVSANAGAIAYAAKSDHEGRSLWRTVGAFLGGKIFVYLALGFLAAILGFRLPTSVLALLRKLSGPLMILIGLYFVGLFRFRGTTGEGITTWIQERLPRRGSPPFWLGFALSLGFCPTMALLFFGRLIPMILQARAGLLLAVVFAVGTVIPVLLWAAALSISKSVAGRWVRQVRSTGRTMRWIAAAVFLLLGVNDTLLYWFV
jgi:cytochrome c-type biogenesis protein